MSAHGSARATISPRTVALRSSSRHESGVLARARTPVFERSDWLFAALVLERDREPNAVAGHLPVLDRDVLTEHFGDAQVPDRPACGLHGLSGGSLPRLLADADHLGHAVHAVTHGIPLAVVPDG